MDWKYQYDKYILNMDLDKAIPLKNNHIPTLYKYRTFDKLDHWIDWVKGMVLASPPKSFNDPFDCILTYDKDGIMPLVKIACNMIIEKYIAHTNDNDIREISESLDPLATTCDILERNNIPVDRTNIRDDIYDLQRQQTGLQEVLRVACFSELNNSILMWSHYSENHKGFCIEYNFDNDKYVSGFLFPVTYDVRRKILNQLLFSSYGWSVLASLCKAPVWRYEKEWRFINSKVDDYPKDAIYGFNAITSIKSIYIGAKADSENIKRLEEISKVPLYKMKMNDLKYELLSGPL